MSTDIKLDKAQTSKISQSGVSFGSWLEDLVKKALTNIVIPWVSFSSALSFKQYQEY